MLQNTPPVVKNLLIINVLMFLATYTLGKQGIDLAHTLGLYPVLSENFNPFQLVSYIFMHGGIDHIFFNMFALWMFGRVLEQVWGSKRFLIYYMIAGVGAGVIQLITTYFSLSGIEADFMNFQSNPSLVAYKELLDEYLLQINDGFHYETYNTVAKSYNNWYANPESSSLEAQAITASQELLNVFRDFPTVGASGSVFGLLLAFGMLFPNTELMLLFPPIPIKAKYFVIGYGVLELTLGISNNPGDNVAHFAHLGGMLFGYLLIRYWKKNTTNFY